MHTLYIYIYIPHTNTHSYSTHILWLCFPLKPTQISKYDLHTQIMQSVLGSGLGLPNNGMFSSQDAFKMPHNFYPDNQTELPFHFASLINLTSRLRCLSDWMDGWTKIPLQYATGRCTISLTAIFTSSSLDVDRFEDEQQRRSLIEGGAMKSKREVPEPTP